MMSKSKDHTTDMVVCALVTIGALNWGLVGAGMLAGGVNLNVVNLIFGGLPVLEAIVYVLVGIAGLAKLIGCSNKKCDTK